MTSKPRLAHLKNARLASVAYFKKQKPERTQASNTERPRIDDNEPSTSDAGDMDVDTEEEETWSWNKSANESESNSECGGILTKKKERILDLKGLGLKTKPHSKTGGKR